MYAKKNAGEVVIKINGLHYIPEKLLQVGKDVVLRNRVIGRCGAISGDLYCHGIKKGLPNSISTFFNSKWSPREVILKFIEACKNVGEVRLENKKAVFESLTNCGIKIKTVLPEVASSFTTSYPTETNF